MGWDIYTFIYSVFSTQKRYFRKIYFCSEDSYTQTWHVFVCDVVDLIVIIVTCYIVDIIINSMLLIDET